MPRGRKTLFKAEILKQAEVMAGYGLIEAQIAHVFQISPFTLSRWKKRHPEFGQALKRGESIANHEVVKSLYKRAIGYNYDEITYEKSKVGGLGIGISKGEIESIKHVDSYKTKITVKEIAPDTTAQIFWLKNRLPDAWRDKTEIKGEGFGETNIYNIINQIRGSIPKDSETPLGLDSRNGLDEGRTRQSESSQEIPKQGILTSPL